MRQEENLKLPLLLATDLDTYFPRLVMAYQQRLFAFALRQTGDVHDAEDIIQEAFIQAYFALSAYPAQRIRELLFQPWLYKITLNIFYARMRKARLQVFSMEAPGGEQVLEIEDNRWEQPEAVIESRELLQELECFVAALPLKYREVVSLYYFEGLSYLEIAGLLNQPLGTVKSNLHRGMLLLRKTARFQEREVM